MKKEIDTTHYINAPLEKVWANISKASGVNTWLPAITSCSLQGQGEGAKRACMAEQGSLLETIVKIDHGNKVFIYTVDQQPFFPIENVLGTMSLQQHNNGTLLNWSLKFSITDESHFAMVKEAIEGMYADGAQGLENISN